jgi:hypothetical protein
MVQIFWGRPTRKPTDMPSSCACDSLAELGRSDIPACSHRGPSQRKRDGRKDDHIPIKFVEMPSEFTSEKTRAACEDDVLLIHGSSKLEP